MTQTTDRLDSLEAEVKAQHISPENMETFRDMVRAYRGIQQWGRFSRLIIITLGAAAAAITAWDVIWSRIGEAFK